MVLDAVLLNTQDYKVSKRPPLHHGVVANEKGAFRSPSTKVNNFSY